MADHVMARTMPYLQRSDDPAGDREENSLYEPHDDLRERSRYPFTFKHSAYTMMQRRPSVRGAVMLAAGMGLAAAVRALNGGPSAAVRRR